jgi:ribonuclease P protein component
VIVPKHQHTAVQRNRLKRRLRELVRVELLPALRALPAHSVADLAIRTRGEAYLASFGDLRSDVHALLGRLGVNELERS